MLYVACIAEDMPKDKRMHLLSCELIEHIRYKPLDWVQLDKNYLVDIGPSPCFLQHPQQPLYSGEPDPSYSNDRFHLEWPIREIYQIDHPSNHRHFFFFMQTCCCNIFVKISCLSLERVRKLHQGIFFFIYYFAWSIQSGSHNINSFRSLMGLTHQTETGQIVLCRTFCKGQAAPAFLEEKKSLP